MENSNPSENVWIIIIIYLLTFFIGTIGNLMVIFVIMLNKKLKTVTNMHLLNLAIADLLYLQIIPFAVITLIKTEWVFNNLLCKVYWMLNAINQFTSVFLVVLLAFDR